VTSSGKIDWLVTAGLLVLSVVPIAAGTVRVFELGAGTEITPNNARFFAAPLPFVLHIFSATVYCVLGAFQFNAGLRRRKLGWHRVSGKILVPCGLVVALSGLWMTLFYPTGIESPAKFDGQFLSAIRLLVGTAMAAFLCFGFAAVRRHDIAQHSAWMIRAYALGLGAGTQVLTHLPWFIFPSIQGEMARTLFMSAGWAVNLGVAQWLIWRWPR
jgi:uncharacterized membrane protein